MSRETTEETEEDDNRQRAGNAFVRFPPLLCWKSQTTSQPGGKHASRCAHKKSTLYCRLYSWGLTGKSVAIVVIEESFRIPLKKAEKSNFLQLHVAPTWIFILAVFGVCKSAERLDHRLQRDSLHCLLDCILDLVVWGFQNLADILRHRAGTTLTGMNPNQFGHALRFQRGIDLVQRDLRGIDTQLSTTGPSGDCNEPRFFQSAENIADYNGIAAGTFRKEIAGHLGNSLCFVDEYQTMNRNGAFYTDLHTAILHPFKTNRFGFDCVVTIDITSIE